MRTLYIDCFSGVSGDMLLGALLDAGASEELLRQALSKLGLDAEYSLEVEPVMKNGVRCIQATVRLEDGTVADTVVEQTCSHGHGQACGCGHAHEGADGCAHDHESGHEAHETDMTDEGACAHEHGACGSEHPHGAHCEQGCDCEHGHAHGHDHEHGHGHSHEHGPSHEHGHSHAHGHEHAHSHAHSTHTHSRNIQDILQIIDNAQIAPLAKEIAQEAFMRLAQAEASVHDVPMAQVHFHEVGAVDAIVDIVGVAILIAQLEPEDIIVSPVNVGSGMVRCAHGLLPVPAPATAALMKDRGCPIYMGQGVGELTTPTGAALIAALANRFGPMPAMGIGTIGYGAGQRDMETLNAVRVFTGMTIKKNVP